MGLKKFMIRIGLWLLPLVGIIGLFAILYRNSFDWIATIGFYATCTGFIISYWVLLNSESIREYVDSNRKKKIVQKNYASYVLDIKAIRNMLRKNEDIEAIKTRIMELIGQLDFYSEGLKSDGNKSLKMLKRDRLYIEKNYPRIDYHINVVLANLTLTKKEEGVDNVY